jgi:uncharacterized protein
MSERYGKLYQRMVDILERLDPEELDRRAERRAAIDELSAGTLASKWVDVATIDREIGAGGGPSIEEAITRHIDKIATWLDDLESEASTQSMAWPTRI